MVKSDYHTHSIFSDGVLTPAELVDMALKNGIEVMALTDHDTMDGIEDFFTAINDQNVAILPIAGMEVSSTWRFSNIHILAYWPDYQNLALANKLSIQKFIDTQKNLRMQRAKLIVEVLQQAGYVIDFEEVCTLAKPSIPTRPHFAKYLISKGYFQRYGEVFQKILGKGRAGDINVVWQQMDEVVRQLKELGAKISLAHPFAYKFSTPVRRQLFKDFKNAGGDAIEIINAMQDLGQIQACISDCHKIGLYMTWGSDFHTPSYAKIGGISNLPKGIRPLFKSNNDI